MARLIDYLTQLQSLLPKGVAWNREEGSTLSTVLAGFAKEFLNVDVRVESFHREADPSRALEMLADWERAVGLPDPCTGPLETLEGRRSAVVARLGSQGGQSREFFIKLAETLGYTITITEHKPFRVGSRVGEALTNGPWQHAWRVTAPETTVRRFKVGAAVGERLATWGNQELECAIERAKPAHTTAIFSYEG